MTAERHSSELYCLWLPWSKTTLKSVCILEIKDTKIYINLIYIALDGTKTNISMPTGFGAGSSKSPSR